MNFKYLLNASAFGLLSAIVTRGGIFIANIILARSLAVEEYGLVSFAYLTALSFGGFVSAGIGQTAAKITSKYGSSDEKKLHISLLLLFKISLVISSAAAVSMFFLSGYIGSSFLNNENVVDLLRVSSVILFFTALAAIYNFIIFSLENYKISSINAISATSFMLIAVMFSVNYASPVVALISLGTAGLVQAILGVIFLCIYIKNNNFYFLQDEVKKIKSEIFSFLRPAMLVALVGAPVHWVCMSLLSSSADGLNQLAIFNVAFQWYLIVSFVPAAVGNMSISFFSRFSSSQNKPGFNKLLLLTVLIVIGISFFIGLPVIILSDYAAILYGKNYESASEVIVFLVCAAIVASISLCLQQFIASIGKIWNNFYFTIVYSVLYFGSTVYALYFSLGALGVAKAVFFASIFLLFIQITYLYIIRIKAANI